MQAENIDLLRRGLDQIALELDDDRITRLIGYHDYVLERNKEMNLIGFKDERGGLPGKGCQRDGV